MSRLAVLVRIALANIFSSFLNVFIGSVLFFGAGLLVVGGSLFTTLDQALSKSIIGSITGHLQVYSARSKDKLEIYGKVDGSDSRLTPIDDWKKVKAELLALPNVDRVVPMGTATALVASGNTVDVVLEQLRALYRAQANPATKLPDDDFKGRVTVVRDHARNIVSVLTKDLDRAKELTTEEALTADEKSAIATISKPEFWEHFDDDPFEHLELLENRIAPLVADADMLFVRCLGTDLGAYKATFDRLTIIEGEAVPTGHRGVLLPKFFTEEYLKLKNARRLDKIREARQSGRKLSNESDKELVRLVRENQLQTRELLLQLDGASTAKAVSKLQTLLKSQEGALTSLLPSFFAVTEENFDERYKFFYEQLAPMLTMYRVKVGDQMTLRSFGKSGSVVTVLVKVYGIFELKGLEKSPLAGANALIDIVTFRDLYGYLSADKKAEAEAMREANSTRKVSREDAEAELFGGADDVVASVHNTKIEDPKLHRDRREQSDTFAPEEIDDGIVLNAAIMLKDGSDAAQKQTLEAIEAVLAKDKPKVDAQAVAAAKTLAESGRVSFPLAATLKGVVGLEDERAKGATRMGSGELMGLEQMFKAERAVLNDADTKTIAALLSSARPKVWAAGWSSASGFLGQFISFFRLLLGGMVAAFAFFALIVVTLGVTIATLQRTQTIGTMRAIGAQREFVVGMVLVETMVLALTFGVAGALFGAGVVEYLNASGIPAFRDELYFFFSGPVLRPELTVSGVVISVLVTLVVSVLAVLFPVYLATRVTPITAMQAAE